MLFESLKWYLALQIPQTELTHLSLDLAFPQRFFPPWTARIVPQLHKPESWGRARGRKKSVVCISRPRQWILVKIKGLLYYGPSSFLSRPWGLLLFQINLHAAAIVIWNTICLILVKRQSLLFELNLRPWMPPLDLGMMCFCLRSSRLLAHWFYHSGHVPSTFECSQRLIPLFEQPSSITCPSVYLTNSQDPLALTWNLPDGSDLTDVRSASTHRTSL